MLELNRLPPERGVAITPDGPRGPRGVVQPGTVWLAASSARLIVPIGVVCSSAWYCRSWDRFMIPKPGSHVVVSYGTPVEVPATLTEADVPQQCQRIADRISEAEQDAAAHLANPRLV